MERIPDIQHISREVDGNVTIVAGNASWTPEYLGVDASYADVFNLKTSEGRFFDQGEVNRSGAKVVVLGATVAEKLLAGESPDRANGRCAHASHWRSLPTRVYWRTGSIVPVTTARSRLPQKETTRHISLI